MLIKYRDIKANIMRAYNSNIFAGSICFDFGGA